MKITLPKLMTDFDGIKTEAALSDDYKEVILTITNYLKRETFEKVIDASEILTDGINESVEVSTVLNVEFTHPDWGVIEGKIDTGADQTSLHAEDIEIVGKYVKFRRNGSTFEMPLSGMTEVSSADSEKVRPNITANITIKETGKRMKVNINLNDRSDMPNELLIGMDILSKDSDLLINPSKTTELTEELFEQAITSYLEKQS